jgi:hypothetical protein
MNYAFPEVPEGKVWSYLRAEDPALTEHYRGERPSLPGIISMIAWASRKRMSVDRENPHIPIWPGATRI